MGVNKKFTHVKILRGPKLNYVKPASLQINFLAPLGAVTVVHELNRVSTLRVIAE